MTTNSQNIPRQDTVIKRAFVPKLGVFHLLDYSQIEPRLAAYFASQIGYPEFAAALRAGEDAYTTVARLATGKTDITPEERQVWKRIFLAILYGAGVRRVREVWIEETAKIITEAQAKKIVRQFHSNWPAIRELQDSVIGVAQRRGYIRALDGRHLHPESFGEHKLLNKLIQGSAAGIMKQAVIDVHQYLVAHEFETHGVSVIHDELILDGTPGEVEAVHEQVPPIMSAAAGEKVQAVVPISVDHEITTTSWADKQAYEEVYHSGD